MWLQILKIMLLWMLKAVTDLHRLRKDVIARRSALDQSAASVDLSPSQEAGFGVGEKHKEQFHDAMMNANHKSPMPEVRPLTWSVTNDRRLEVHLGQGLGFKYQAAAKNDDSR